MTVEECLPKLASAGFRRISEATETYNCLAWAAGYSDTWWDIADGYYWPEGIPRTTDVDSLISVYETLGYVCCQSRELEHGFEKIALYGDKGAFTHAARQLATGKWTSKIGTLEDIEHDGLDELCGQQYGEVIEILKRKSQ